MLNKAGEIRVWAWERSLDLDRFANRKGLLTCFIAKNKIS